MSSSFGQQNGGLSMPRELQEPMSLPDILVGTTFVSAHGRIYRLFGNEEEPLSLPVIPPLPPVLMIPEPSALSLEEALQQIDLFSSQESHEKQDPSTRECSAGVPALQVFHTLGESASNKSALIESVLGESISLRSISKEHPQPRAGISAEEIISSGLQHLSGAAAKPLTAPKREELLHILAESVEEPLIIPFTPPPPSPEETCPEVITLKIVSETGPKIVSPKLVRIRRHRRGKAVYRKPCTLPKTAENHREPAADHHETPPSLPAAAPILFQWPEQLDILMKTAENQIRMLAEHLLVQSNQGTKTICFKSVFSGDGCSTILLCAVRALLERHYRILLIDTHYQHIDLPKQLSLPKNAVMGNEVMTLSESFGFWVWQESNSAEKNRTILTNLLSAHREEYDLILLDNGSVTESPLSELIDFWNGSGLEGLLLVANTKRPSEIPVSHIAGRLRQHQIPLIGVAENYV